MAVANALGDEFRREADMLIRRLHGEGKLGPLRAVLERLLGAATTMNLGDVSECRVESLAEREVFALLGDSLGCLAVLRQKRDDTVLFELFSKRRLMYLAESATDESTRES